MSDEDRNNPETIGYVVKKWEDATGGVSKIERLTFDADHNWTDGKITVTGTRSKSWLEIEANAGSKNLLDTEFKIKNEEVMYFDFKVRECRAVAVTGKLQNWYVFGAGALVSVSLGYSKTEKPIKKVEKSWSDSTAGISCIEGLGIDATHHWKSCVIEVVGDKDQVTGCLLTLLVDGDLYGMDLLEDSFTISGTSSKIFEFNIDKKSSLLVAGYITNAGVFTGGGLRITLTATYEED